MKISKIIQLILNIIQKFFQFISELITKHFGG